MLENIRNGIFQVTLIVIQWYFLALCKFINDAPYLEGFKLHKSGSINICFCLLPDFLSTGCDARISRTCQSVRPLVRPLVRPEMCYSIWKTIQFTIMPFSGIGQKNNVSA